MNYKILLRLGWFVSLAGVWYSDFWLVGSLLTAFYLFRYSGYEIVLLGLALDIQFMTGSIPWYTIFFFIGLSISQVTKPYLLAYDN